MLGAVAARTGGSISEAMAAMSAIGQLSEPTAPGMADFHRNKRKVHGLMRTLDRENRDTMQGTASIAGLEKKT
jgi:D-ribulokinase